MNKISLLHVKPTVCILLLLCCLATTARAQESLWVTPFTRAVVDSTGKKVRIQPQPKLKSPVSISLGYGLFPHTANSTLSTNTASVLRISMSQKKQVKVPLDIASDIGTLSLGFGYEIVPWLEFNFFFFYSQSKGTFTEPSGMKDVKDFRDTWFGIMPSMKVFWARNHWISIYSRVGAGAAFVNRKTHVEAKVYSGSTLSWQLSPVGVELGSGTTAFFIEGGYGFQGVVNTGFRFRINTGKRFQNRSEYNDFLYHLLF